MEFLRHILFGMTLFLSIDGFSMKSMAFEGDINPCDFVWWQTADLPQVEQMAFYQWQIPEMIDEYILLRIAAYSQETSEPPIPAPLLCYEGRYSLFELAVMWNPYPEVIDFLFELGLPIQNQEDDKENLLYLAAFNANPEILDVVQKYISEGPRLLRLVSRRNIEPREDSNVYFGVAGGVHSSSTMNYEGWNQDTTCYPTQVCFRNGLDSPASGYRWAYDVSAEKPGMALQGFVGYRAEERIRIEVSAGLQTAPLQQEFKHIQQRVGSQYIPAETDPHTTVISPSQAYIGDVTIGDVSFNGYVDLLDPNRRVVPYAGVGVGFSGIKINDLDFSERFEDPQNPKGYTPPLSVYDSMTDGSVFDVLPTVYLHLGFDVNVTDQTSIGFKSTLSKTMGDIVFRDTYLSHPMNYWPPLQTGLMPQGEEMGFHYDTSLMGIQNWRTMLEVKWKWKK